MDSKKLPNYSRCSLQYLFAFITLLLVSGDGYAQVTKNSSDKLVVEESEEEVVDSEQELPPVGIKLGDFFYRDVRASEGVKLRISFTLFAEVKQEEEDRFLQIYDHTVKRIRDQVIIAIRLSETHDFQEASLMKLKRRIKIRLHRVIPQLEIEDLMLRDFTYFTDTD